MDLYIHENTGEELEDFVDDLSEIFNLKFLEGESLNYPPHNRYFTGYGKFKNIKLWDDDSETIKGYTFVLSLDDNTHKKGHVLLPDNIVDIANRLVEIGVRSFIPEGNYWEIGWFKTSQEYPVTN